MFRFWLNREGEEEGVVDLNVDYIQHCILDQGFDQIHQYDLYRSVCLLCVCIQFYKEIKKAIVCSIILTFTFRFKLTKGCICYTQTTDSHHPPMVLCRNPRIAQTNLGWLPALSIVCKPPIM